VPDLPAGLNIVLRRDRGVPLNVGWERAHALQHERDLERKRCGRRFARGV
jgi:hypothetical protein